MATTFVVGTDGSECARRAAELAAEHAKESGGDLTLVAVVEWSRYSFLTPEELETRAKDKKAEAERAQSQVLDPLKTHLELNNASVKTLVRHGHAAEVLSEVAKEEGASQIFIGRHGRSTLEAAVFGSVTNKLLRVTTVPVTVVP